MRKSNMKLLTFSFFYSFCFLSFLFLYSFPHTRLKNCMLFMTNLHTKWLLYYQEFFFSWLELHVSWDHKLWLLTRAAVCFCTLFVHTCTHTLKLKGVQGHYTYWMTALLLNITFLRLELYVIYDRWVVDPNTQHNLFPIQHFAPTYTHNSKTIGCMWIFYLLNDCMLYYWRCQFTVLELDVRYRIG